MNIDKTIRSLFEVSLVAFACVAILSTMSMITVNDNFNTAEASIMDSTNVQIPGERIEWRQINDVMVPVEFVEFPPMHISIDPNTLYIGKE